MLQLIKKVAGYATQLDSEFKNIEEYEEYDSDSDDSVDIIPNKVNLKDIYDSILEKIKKPELNNSEFDILKISYHDSLEGGTRYPPNGPIPKYAKCASCENEGPRIEDLIDREKYLETLKNYSNFFHEPTCENSSTYWLMKDAVIEDNYEEIINIIKQKEKDGKILPNSLTSSEPILYTFIYKNRGEYKYIDPKKKQFLKNAILLTVSIPKELIDRDIDIKSSISIFNKKQEGIIKITFMNVPYYTRGNSLFLNTYIKNINKIINNSNAEYDYSINKKNIIIKNMSGYIYFTDLSNYELTDRFKQNFNPELDFYNCPDISLKIYKRSLLINISSKTKEDKNIKNEILNTKLEDCSQRIINSFNIHKDLKQIEYISKYKDNKLPIEDIYVDVHASYQPNKCKVDARPAPFKFSGFPPTRLSTIKLGGEKSQSYNLDPITKSRVYLYIPCSEKLTIKRSVGNFTYRYIDTPYRVMKHLRDSSIKPPTETLEEKLQQVDNLPHSVQKYIRRMIYGFPNNKYPNDYPELINYDYNRRIDITVTGEDRRRIGLLTTYKLLKKNRGEEYCKQFFIRVLQRYIEHLEFRNQSSVERTLLTLKVLTIINETSEIELGLQDDIPITRIKVDKKTELPFIECGKTYIFIVNFQREYDYENQMILYTYNTSPLMFTRPMELAKIIDDDEVTIDKLDEIEFPYDDSIEVIESRDFI